MTKQEFIKQAFGKSWDKLSLRMQDHILTRHHWVDRSSNRMNLSPGDLGFEESECEIRCEFWRPIALKGIETNNGWTKIESGLSNIVDGVFEFLVKKEYCVNDEAQKDVLHVNEFLRKDENMAWNVYSHYRPLKEDVLPLY